MKRLRNLIWPCLLLLGVTPVVATFIADACPALVQQALDTTDEVCTTTGRNQACYGHAQMEAQAHPGAAAFTFDTAGDIIDVTDVQSLHLSPLQVENGNWGVALMRLQANLPSSQTEDLTLLTFGDVSVNNAVPTPTRLDVTVSGSDFVNVRRLPNAETAAVSVLSPGQTVTALERLEDQSWLRVELPDSGDTGWVSASLLSTAGDISTLNIGQSRQPFYRPMQAFYFQSGMDQSVCANVPTNGLLIQTPEGVGEVKLLINEVNIQVGSTVLFQAEPNGEMIVTTLEGHARVEAMGVVHTAVAGTQVRVPLDANLKPSGPPSVQEAYDPAPLQALPLGNLERAIEVHPPLTEAEIQQVQQDEAATECDCNNADPNNDTDPGISTELPSEEQTDSSNCPGNSCHNNHNGDCPGNSCHNNDNGNGNGGGNGNGNGGGNGNGNGNGDKKDKDK
jgi:hypothetical protein